jgi:hypothetical protein
LSIIVKWTWQTSTHQENRNLYIASCSIGGYMVATWMLQASTTNLCRPYCLSFIFTLGRCMKHDIWSLWGYWTTFTSSLMLYEAPGTSISLGWIFTPSRLKQYFAICQLTRALWDIISMLEDSCEYTTHSKKVSGPLPPTPPGAYGMAKISLSPFVDNQTIITWTWPLPSIPLPPSIGLGQGFATPGK